MGINLSVIVTVKNDEVGIKRLLADLKKQTVRPDEVIIVRADKGVYRNLKEFKGNVRVVLAEVDCTRGKGRNIGVKMARNELIAVTDVGCRPRRDWIEKLLKGLCAPKESSFASWSASTPAKSDPSGFGRTGDFFRRKKSGPSEKIVVAGWYRAVAETPWQKAFLPYLVPAGVNKGPALLQQQGRAFLPASRSIAFTKKAWALVGGYPEEPVSGGEDLKFADNLYKNPEINIVFEPEALVDWPVPATLEEFIKDMVKHTRGNFEAGYWPHIVRNLSVVVRWAVLLALPLLIPMYLFVAVFNKGPALRGEQGRALRALRMITARVAADAAVVYGTVIGIIDEWVIKKLRLPDSGG